MRAAFYFPVFIFFFHFSALAQPKGIHLSWNGAKKVNTTGSIAITWMNEKSDASTIAYGTDSLTLKKSKKVNPRFVPEAGVYISKATLKKLKPATTYYYRIGSEKSGWSNLYRFKTAPEAGDERKIVVGVWSDTQNNGTNKEFQVTDSVVKQMARYSFDFTAHNGDIVENGSVIDSWKNFFITAEPLLANNPFMSVTGNHDVVNDTASADFQKPFPVFYEFFNLPQDNLNYSYDYGNVHFIAINSGWAQGAARVNKVLFEKGSDEYKWLKKDLEKARKNKHIKWIILCSHYPVYSYGFSFIQQWQQALVPLIDEYKVDLVLSGHRHVYERHAAIRNGEVYKQESFNAYNNPKGTVYITNGSAGGSLQGLGGDKLPSMVFTSKQKVYNYAIMTIEGENLKYEVFDKEGNMIDHFTIAK